MDALPANCRQRLMATGQPYPKSSCEACGTFSPRWEKCNEACKEHVEFHLQPGDRCRLLDGPFMIYLGTEEHDDQAHCFAYWSASNGTNELVVTHWKPSVARFVEKVGQ